MAIEVDSNCPGASQYTVFGDFNAMLNQTNIGANNNKFYVIQLLEKGGKHYVWTRWGRDRGRSSVGLTLGGNHRPFVGGFSAAEWKAFDERTKQMVLQHFRLAYLSDAWVNWCPALGTVLANDEVKDGVSERGGHPVERKRMPQWSMRITAFAQRLLEGLDTLDWSESIKEAQRNWIGKSEGALVRFKLKTSNEQIEVFTTRPDTLFGVTFVTLAPEHDLVAAITTTCLLYTAPSPRD